MSRPGPTDRAARKSRPALLVAVLAWLMPGLAHWWIGERARGAILSLVTTVTFWGGVAVGGVRSTVTMKENGAWIAAQLCMGPQALGALYWSHSRSKLPEAQQFRAAWPASNISVVYAGVAGLLNLLIIIDALARNDALAPPDSPRGPPGRGGG